jgi:hypothetical protein
MGGSQGPPILYALWHKATESIPVVGVSEIKPEGKTYQQWTPAQLDALDNALSGVSGEGSKMRPTPVFADVGQVLPFLYFRGLGVAGFCEGLKKRPSNGEKPSPLGSRRQVKTSKDWPKRGEAPSQPKTPRRPKIPRPSFKAKPRRPWRPSRAEP